MIDDDVSPSHPVGCCTISWKLEMNPKGQSLFKQSAKKQKQKPELKSEA